MAVFGFLLTTLISLIPLIASFVVLMRIRTMKRRADLHEAIIADLSRRVAELSSGEKPVQTSAVEPADAHTPQVPASEHTATDAAPVDSPPYVIPPPPPHHVQSQRELEMVFGGTWLTRIGAVAIVLGALFFLKFAFDNGWITEPMRVVIGAVVGLGLLVGAERWRAKGLRVFAQGLAGAGVPILYLAVYASYGFYDLVSQPVAFGLMSIVTVLTVFTSLRHESVFIASMAAVGGMLTPAWLSTGDVNTVGLFGYLAVLFIGLLWLGYRRPSWWSLPLISYVAIWGYWNQWMGMQSSMADPDITEGTLFAFLFLVSGLMYHYLVEQQPKDQLISVRRIFISLHSFIMYTMVIRAMMSDSPWINGVAASLLGMLFITSALLYRQNANGVAASIFTVFGLVALDHACLFIEDTYQVSIGLSVLSMMSMWVLRNREHRPPEMATIIMIAFQSLSMAWHEASVHSFPTTVVLPLLSFRTGALVLAGFGVIISSRATKSILRHDSVAASMFSTFGFGAVIWAIHLDVYSLCANTDNVSTPLIDAFRSWPDAFGHAAASMCSVLMGSLLVLVPGRRREEGAILAGIAAIAVASAWWLTHSSAIADPSLLPPFASIRTLTGVIIMASIAMAALRVQTSTVNVDVRIFRASLGGALVLFSFIFLTIEVTWSETVTIHLITSEALNASLSDAWNRFHLRMSGTWTVYSIVLMIIGFVRRMRLIRIASLLLLVITISKVFLYDLSFLGQPYRIVSFIVLGIILLAAGFMYQRYKGIILNDSSR